ncbi:hypothetical protein [Deinococcus rubellus]|uniref:Uncharacterized protein n=1 Tax=Deinococcus rubellus TaxID=1889240 RepID=A0ABY5YF52_9DEIO|nr:hypothetical protein [Deinococcus rubellus]UWX63719.1 hypothetical protein N0D28_13425 [Deinococcus rubellus]
MLIVFFALPVYLVSLLLHYLKANTRAAEEQARLACRQADRLL